MNITWEDRKNIGKIDNELLQEKPVFSFDYAWFLLTDETAQFVATHDEGTYNEDMNQSQVDEVTQFYNGFVRQGVPPVYDPSIEKIVDSTVTEDIDGKTYTTFNIVPLTQEELDARYQASIPSVITMRQARLALLQAGLLATVTAAIEAGTDEVMKIEWEYSDEVRRDWASLITMAGTLGLDSAALDNLFVTASTL